jgi:hypothetical protein
LIETHVIVCNVEEISSISAIVWNVALSIRLGTQIQPCLLCARDLEAPKIMTARPEKRREISI